MTSPSRHATSIPPASRRVWVLFLAILLAVHSFLVLMWVMPSNPVRDAVGNERVSAYINNDYVSFQQSWSIFAPVPRRAGENVQVRATLGGSDGRAGETTEWYDITADEDRRVLHLVNPSRIHAVTRRVGSDLIQSVASFNDVQRGIVAADLRSGPRRHPSTAPGLGQQRRSRGGAGGRQLSVDRGEAGPVQHDVRDRALG